MFSASSIRSSRSWRSSSSSALALSSSSRRLSATSSASSRASFRSRVSASRRLFSASYSSLEDDDDEDEDMAFRTVEQPLHQSGVERIKFSFGQGKKFSGVNSFQEGFMNPPPTDAGATRTVVTPAEVDR